MNICKKCKKPKSEDEFTRCKKCRQDRNRLAKAYYDRWNKVVNKNNREYYHKNRKKFKLRNRNAALKRKYGIDLETFEKMFTEQKSKCGLCKQPLIRNNKKGWGGKLEPCVDHDHKTGKVRGILHRGCNLALSMIEDQTFMTQATQYLNKLVK